MSYTIKLVSGSLQMIKTSILNYTVMDSPGISIGSLNILDKLNLKYCNSPGLLYTDISGDVITKLIDTDDINDSVVTSNKLQDSIFLSGVPTTTTASIDTNTTQIATTAFVNAACLNISGSASEEISGVKTFNTLPILVPLASVGIIHNDASGQLTTSLIQTSDIDKSAVTTDKINDAAITSAKLELNLVLPLNTTIDTTSVNTDTKSIVSKGFLAASIKPFSDTLSNDQPVDSIKFLHIDNSNVSTDIDIRYFTLSNNIRHIVDVTAKILLPVINKEGIFYSVINKSEGSIDISTNSINELIFNSFVAPDGDNDFNLGPNQCLEFISIVSNGISSWQAQYY